MPSRTRTCRTPSGAPAGSTRRKKRRSERWSSESRRCLHAGSSISSPSWRAIRRPRSGISTGREAGRAGSTWSAPRHRWPHSAAGWATPAGSSSRPSRKRIATSWSRSAAGYSSQLALTDALYGYPDVAAGRARRIPADASFEPQLRGAAALALAGFPADAESGLRACASCGGPDTLLHAAYLPVADAATQLARDRPDAALEALRPAAPYERGTVAALLPIYLRAEARRRTRAFGEAAREFRAVIANRGADPFSPSIPLAYWGLARSLAAVRRPGGEPARVWRSLHDLEGRRSRTAGAHAGAGGSGGAGAVGGSPGFGLWALGGFGAGNWKR